MLQIKSQKIIRLLVASWMIVVLLLPAVPVSAALNNISMSLSDPRPSQSSVNYTFTSSGFDTGTTIRCIDVLLNTAADGSGSAVGTTTSFALSSATAITAGSWTANNSVNGRLRLTNATGQTPSASGNIVFGTITNGATVDTTYYAIFTSYTDASCTGGNEVDQGVATFLYKNGTLFQLTIPPSLTFTCVGVGSGQSVNGATTTVASTASDIDHGSTVTSSVNGISAHDLQITTNSANGYTLDIRQSGALTNGTNNITVHTGTNAAPSAFPAAGTEAWGYTTEDFTLAGGTANRFQANLWAGFPTTNELVADNTTFGSGTQTTRVGQQVGISASTPAGTYQTTIIYTVTSIY